MNSQWCFYLHYVKTVPYIALILFLCASCSNEDDAGILPLSLISEVTVDLLQVPYPTLSEYGFFNDTLSELKPTTGVLPYEPISSLFSNYAQKIAFYLAA